VSIVCVPLVHNSEPTGVLLVTSSRVGPFDDTHERVLAELAGFVSTVIRNAWDMARAMNGLLSDTGTSGAGAAGTGTGSPKPATAEPSTVETGTRFGQHPGTNRHSDRYGNPPDEVVVQTARSRLATTTPRASR
jgi:hypothetical protein